MFIGHCDGEARKVCGMKIDWKQIGRFVSIIVKLYSHLTETFKKVNVGPEILEWATSKGKEVFEKEFLVPLADRYSETDKPFFKVWPEICKINDWNLMVALSRADLKSELGRRLRRGFPECFTENALETHGPVPWSLLVVRGKDEAARKGETHAQDLWGLGILDEFNLPHETISITDENYQRYGRGNEWLFVPELAGKCGFGKVAKWNNHDYVSVSPCDQSNDWCDGETVLVPAECIDLNA